MAGFQKAHGRYQYIKTNQVYTLQPYGFNLQYLTTFTLNDLIEDFFISSPIGLFSMIINVQFDSCMTLSQAIKSKSLC